MEDNKNLNFEEALSELEELTQNLEDGTMELHKSMELFRRGVYLTSFLKEEISKARTEVKILTLDENDEMAEIDFNPGDEE